MDPVKQKKIEEARKEKREIEAKLLGRTKLSADEVRRLKIKHRVVSLKIKQMEERWGKS